MNLSFVEQQVQPDLINMANGPMLELQLIDISLILQLRVQKLSRTDYLQINAISPSTSNVIGTPIISWEQYQPRFLLVLMSRLLLDSEDLNRDNIN